MAEYFLPLKDRREVAEGTMAFWFDISGTDLTFEPGQNADYTLIDPPETDAEGNMRTFSFAASPSHKDTIMITTRMRPTAFKNSLKAIPLGTKVKVEAPLGDMMLHEDVSRPAVLLAGGIGITPFRSMIEWASERQSPHKIFLFYGNRDKKATAFFDDLEQWSTKNPNFKFVPTLDQAEPDWKYETGHIDANMVKKYVANLQQPIYYIAGPPAMGTALRKMLLVDLGVSRDSIRTESFTGY